ncbi:hypothetical protein UFOVP1360_14 [uncultured Caudovirales phage]|uniref:Uncharacterized protein n=1 Tax=uncultured Caudovirales phage TaxID=2100421 RepID=A0A6J5S4N4_9CAUD|nr:hypothetical protein UFOVP1360_14 [uncultured Caudovirales phage]
MNKLNTEPVAIGGAITGLATAGLAAANAFGADLSGTQNAAILGVIAAIITIVTVLTRSSVTPTTRVDEEIRPAEYRRGWEHEESFG